MTALTVPNQNVPDVDAVIALALDAVPSHYTKRKYGQALAEYLAYRKLAGEAFNRASVNGWRTKLIARGLAPSTVNANLAAIRKLAHEASANGYLDAGVAHGIDQVENVRQTGTRAGNWLTAEQAQQLINAPSPASLKGKRDRCALALLLGCALRRFEAAAVTFEHIQPREGRWAIVDLRGKRDRIRTIALPTWVKDAVVRWAAAAGISSGRVLRSLARGVISDSMSTTAVYDVAARYGREIGIPLKAHDLRRTCAKLARKAGGELEQIQIMLGHASILTTQLYLGTTQDLVNAPNDQLGLEWKDAE